MVFPHLVSFYRRSLTAALGVVCCLAFVSTPARAQQDPDNEAAGGPVSLSALIDTYSTYVWRGIRMNDSWVVQPSVTVEWHGLSLNAWSSIDLKEYPSGSGNGGGRFTEMDCTLAYGRSLGKMTLSAGALYYGLRDFADTTELFTTVSFDAPLSPSLSAYYDVDEGDGGFLIASVAHEFPFVGQAPLRIGATASFNLRNKAMGLGADDRRYSGPYSGEISAATTIPLGPGATLTPKIAYTTGLGNNGQAALRSLSYDGGTHTRFYAGVSLVTTF